MRAVQRCVESKISPVLRSKNKSTCKTIKDFSTETLLPCFLRSVVDFKSIRLSFSICDIKYTDWATVLWTINGLKDDTSNPGLKALIDAIGECRDGPQQQGFEFKGNSVDSGMRMIRLTAGKINQELEPAFDSDKYDALSDRVAKQLAAQLHWERNGVQWIPFIGSHGDKSEADKIIHWEQNGVHWISFNSSHGYSSETDQISFNILLGSRSIYDFNAEGVVKADMNSTVLDLADAIGNGTLSIAVDENLTLTKFYACRDINCQESYIEVIPKLRITTSTTSTVTTTTVTTSTATATTKKRSRTTLKDITRSIASFSRCSGAGCLVTGNAVTPEMNVGSQRSSGGTKVEPVVQSALCGLILKYFAQPYLF